MPPLLMLDIFMPMPHTLIIFHRCLFLRHFYMLLRAFAATLPLRYYLILRLLITPYYYATPYALMPCR